MRAALIKKSTGLVENVIEMDAVDSDWPVPDGYEVVVSDTAGIGMAYAAGVFTPPPAVTP